MKITKTKSSNNYKILHIEKESPISLILFLVKNGSRYENEKNAGISHFLEHLMFKPTLKRTTSKAISMEIESIGGVTNAFTGQEYTGYYIQVLKEHYDHAFEILSDLLQNGVLDQKDIDIERGNIIEEIRMYEDSPSDMVGEYAMLNIFPNQPLGRPIIGTEQTVNSFNKNDFSRFINTNYLQDDFLVVSVGDFGIERVQNNVESLLKTRQAGDKEFDKAVFSPAQRLNLHHKEDINQTHMVISFEGVSMYHDDIYKYSMLDMVLGGGMGSILFDLLREQLGVAYYVGANHSEFSDAGTFQIYFGANFEKTKETVDRTFNELDKLKKEVISEDELNRAKNLLYSYMAMKHESVGYLGSKYGGEVLLKDEITTLEEEQQKIYAITVDDIRETAQKVFNDNYNITYIANRELL
jgi:predicted Zn-dependent peptidase